MIITLMLLLTMLYPSVILTTNVIVPSNVVVVLGNIVIVEPMIDIHVGYVNKVIVTSPFSGSIVEGRIYVELTPLCIV